MSLTRLALRLAAPLPKIEAHRRYLFVGPHPDDIEIGAGATAAKLAAAGKDVCFLICTDGRYGTDHSGGVEGDALSSLRREEALASARVLGVTDVRFLDLPDGGGYTQQTLLTGIAGVLADFRPEVVFAPDPSVTSECHVDHLNVGEAVRRLACAAPNPGVMAQYGASAVPVSVLAYYMTARPTRFVGTRGYTGKQLEAIFACHRSQFSGDTGSAIRLYLTLRSVDFGLRSLKGRAEGFRVLGPTHMHCLPEAGR